MSSQWEFPYQNFAFQPVIIIPKFYNQPRAGWGGGGIPGETDAGRQGDSETITQQIITCYTTEYTQSGKSHLLAYIPS